MTEILDRVDRRVHRHRTPLTVLSVTLLALGLLWTTQITTHLERTETLHVEDAYTERGWFTYAAPVEREAAGFSRGDTLGMGEPGYFTTVSPRLHVEFRWALTDPPGTPATAEGTLHVLMRATGEGDRILWELREPLDATTAVSLPDAPLHLSGVLDLEAMDALVEERLRAHGGRSDRVTWTLVSDVTYAADLPFGHREGTRTYTFPIEYDGPLYVLPGPEGLDATTAHGKRSVSVQESRAGAVALANDPLPLAATFAGVLGLVVARRGRVHALAERLTHGEDAATALAGHADWVVLVDGPLDAREDDVDRVDLPDLPSLARKAADHGVRAVYDLAEGAFHVHTPDRDFRFAQAGAPPTPRSLAPPPPRDGPLPGARLKPVKPVRASVAKLTHRYRGT